MKLHALPLLFALLTVTLPATAAPVTGQPAPDFTGKDSKGQIIQLSALKGQTVVLEWTNHDCPFVRKFYGAGKMQELQKQAAANNVTWISVISSAPGKQGNVTPEEADKLTADRGAAPAHVVLDPSGEIGKLYAAKTTPHMFVIDAEGVLRYQGAMDDAPSTNPADIAKAKNYVMAALDDLKAGRAVADSTTKPYGCGVKYGE